MTKTPGIPHRLETVLKKVKDQPARDIVESDEKRPAGLGAPLRRHQPGGDQADQLIRRISVAAAAQPTRRIRPGTRRCKDSSA